MSDDARQSEILELMKTLGELLMESGRYYDELKKAYDTAINELTVIEPKLEKSKKDADICHVAGNTGGVVGMILTGVGIFATPLTAGASLALTAVGAGLMGAGGIVTIGAAIGNSVVKKMSYSEAIELLSVFEGWKTQLHKKIDSASEIAKIINEKRNLDTYSEIFKDLFPENAIQYKFLDSIDNNPDFIERFSILGSVVGATNVAKSVYLFVNALDSLVIQGARVTANAFAKVLLPIGAVINTGFLIAAITELAKDQKCDVATMVGLMKETIEKDMEDINGITFDCHDVRLF